MNRFDRSDIVIHNIDPIQYHQNSIHPIELTGVKFLISMGLDPELLQSEKIIRLWKPIFSHIVYDNVAFSMATLKLVSYGHEHLINALITKLNTY